MPNIILLRIHFNSFIIFNLFLMWFLLLSDLFLNQGLSNFCESGENGFWRIYTIVIIIGWREPANNDRYEVLKMSGRCLTREVIYVIAFLHFDSTFTVIFSAYIVLFIQIPPVNMNSKSNLLYPRIGLLPQGAHCTRKFLIFRKLPENKV